MWKIFFKKPAKAFGAVMTTIFMVLPSLLGATNPSAPVYAGDRRVVFGLIFPRVCFLSPARTGAHSSGGGSWGCPRPSLLPGRRSLFLDVGAADEAALAQVGPELPEGLVQRILIQRLAALLIVKGREAGGVGDEAPGHGEQFHMAGGVGGHGPAFR